MSARKQLADVAYYLVGWIAPLVIEQTVAIASLDEIHDEPENFIQPDQDYNTYTWGSIKGHNVVIVSLGEVHYGNVNASRVATRMRLALPKLRVGLLVGIGAGINVFSNGRDIRLGDLVVSQPSRQVGGVIQYDLTRIGPGGPERVGVLPAPPEALLQALGKLNSMQTLQGSQIPQILRRMYQRWPKLVEDGFTHPGTECDRLFGANSNHTAGARDCGSCDQNAIVERPIRNDPTNTRVHYGVIASGNRLMRNAEERDRLLEQIPEDCLCLEMEAAGVMDAFPCLVVRGICDYADTHKNDRWQKYAAITAAAFATELLGELSRRKVESTKPIESVIVEDISQRNRRTIENWISTEDQSSRHQDEYNKRLKGTGDWFLEATRGWRQKSGARQWCLGVEGTGKTILASSLISLLQDEAASDQRKVLHYYFNYKNRDYQKADVVCASLLKQLSAQSIALLPTLKLFYDRLSPPMKEDIFSAFIQESKKAGSVFIVVDALDECRNDDCSVAEILELLRRLPTNVNWLITARDTPEFQNMANKDGGFLRIRSREDDVKKFLQKSIAGDYNLMGYIRKEPELEGKIQMAVIQDSGSNFLLAKLWLNILKSCTSDIDVCNSLKKPPLGLKEAYAQTYQRICDRGETYLLGAHRALTWAVHARRPLSRAEFRHALAIEKGANKYELDNVFEDSIISWCAGLIVVDEQSQFVRLIHETAQEYLKEKLNEDRTALARIANACISYLTLPIEVTASDYVAQLQTYPFLAYSARHWGDHVLNATKDKKVVSNAMRLLRDDAALNRSINVIAFPWKADAIDRDAAWYEESVHQIFVSATPACIAAYFGLVQCLERLWQDDNASFNSSLCSKQRTPLHYAAANGHDNAVKWLLSHGTNVNAQDVHGIAPLHLAAFDGSEKVLQSLLNHSPDVRVRTRDLNESTDLSYSEPLHWAVLGMNSSAVELLIQHKAYCEAKTAWHRTPLHLAARHGLVQIAKVLIDAGARIEAERDGRQTSLIWAVEGNHCDTARLLVEQGAKINVSSYNGSPVEWAFYHGGLSRDILLPPAHLEHNLIALKFALTQALSRRALLEREVENIERMLDCAAETDSKISSRSLRESRAYLLQEFLAYTLRLPNFSSVEVLLALGADFGTVDKYNRSLLHMALHWDRFDIFQRGLERGLDARAKDRQGCEPLHHAASGGCMKGIVYLLGSGSEVGATDNQGWTALHWASFCGHEEIAAYLIEHQSPKEARDSQGRTALDVALAVRPAQRTLIELLDEDYLILIENRLQQMTIGEASWWLCTIEPSSMASGLDGYELQWDKYGVKPMMLFCNFDYGSCCNERWIRIWCKASKRFRDGLRSHSAIYDYRKTRGDASWCTEEKFAFCVVCSYPTLGARYSCDSDADLNFCMRCVMDKDGLGYKELSFTNVFRVPRRRRLSHRTMALMERMSGRPASMSEIHSLAEFLETEIGGDMDDPVSEFHSLAGFVAATFGGDTDDTESEFHSLAEFLAATFGGDMDDTGSKFHSLADFLDPRFAGIHSLAEFLKARIGGDMDDTEYEDDAWSDEAGGSDNASLD